ncbi:MAG: hypothetical protein KC455_10215, partial [Carnobacterium sp.]|nr:hypothetical protein [Carnobacterium sp.]
EVNKKELEKNLFHFIDSWEHTFKKEVSFLKQFDIHFILNDISPIGILIGKELKIKNIGL